MIVKDGTEQAEGLGRVPQFDQRSRSFPIREVLEVKKPRSYTWNFRTYDPKLDQGQEGACVGFGWGNELACYPAVVPSITNQFAREQIYWEAQKTDPWSGGSYPNATPRYEGTSVLAGAKVVQHLGFLGEYRWCFGLDDLILAVGFAGPVVLGLDWLNGMFRPDVRGYIHATGGYAGGHCLIARGVNLKKQRFLLRNSWGASWGMDGDCWIDFDDMGVLLSRQGEACVPVTRSR